ncbi:MAG: hypothetical protein RMK57_03395 [Bryobacterales bacterium]|nr:hypothetical protein [Bryobacteraceae bacterium]MDW8353553.1 hypothetical protein [Bryobacterales bacterium]
MGARCPSWHSPRVLLSLVLVFLCGMMAGALLMRYGVHGMLHGREAALDPRLTVENLRRELDLTPQQAEQLKIILDDFVMYVQSLQSQMDEVRGAGKERIRRILDPEQQRKFDQLMAQIQAQAQR